MCDKKIEKSKIYVQNVNQTQAKLEIVWQKEVVSLHSFDEISQKHTRNPGKLYNWKPYRKTKIIQRFHHKIKETKDIQYKYTTG